MTRVVYWPGLREEIPHPAEMYGNEMKAWLEDGDAGTEGTLAAMCALVDNAAAMADVQKFARDEIRNTPMKLYWWLRGIQDFVPDPPGQELCRHPVQLIDQVRSSGRVRCDCDDIATFACTLLMASQPRMRPMFIVYRKTDTGNFVHVAWGIRDLKAGKAPFDPQEKITPGQYTTRIFREFEI